MSDDSIFIYRSVNLVESIGFLGYPAKIDFFGFFLYGTVLYGPVGRETYFVERLERWNSRMYVRTVILH